MHRSSLNRHTDIDRPLALQIDANRDGSCSLYARPPGLPPQHRGTLIDSVTAAEALLIEKRLRMEQPR